MLQKKCLLCKEIKNVAEFNKCKSKALGYQNECRECGKIKAKKWREKNLEWARTRQNEYYSKNKERLRNAIYAGRKKDPEKNKDIRKKSYYKLQKKHLEDKKKYYANNSEIIKKKVAEYQIKNSYKIVYTKMKYGSKKRGLGNLELTFDEFVEFRESNKTCFYCPNELPEFGSGMDRIDNKVGYILSNVVPCCTKCNIIRGDNLTHEEMVVAMSAVNNFRILGKR